MNKANIHKSYTTKCPLSFFEGLMAILEADDEAHRARLTERYLDAAPCNEDCHRCKLYPAYERALNTDGMF